MAGSRRVQGAGSAATEGARRATGVGADAAAVGSGPWRPASGGARAGNGTWCCGCCAASRSTRSRVKSASRSIAWSGGRPGRWPVSSWGSRSRPVSRWPPSWMRPSGTSGNCRWRTSCCGRVPAQRSVASLWRRGGRDDEPNDLRDDRGDATVSSGCVERGSGRARRSTPGGLVCSTRRGLLAHAAAGRRPRCRMRSCWRPFATTWPAPRSRARAIARSTRGCGSSTGSGSLERGCCG